MADNVGTVATRDGHVTLVLKLYTSDADALIALAKQIASVDGYESDVETEVDAAWELVVDAWVKAYGGPGPLGMCIAQGEGSEWYGPYADGTV